MEFTGELGSPEIYRLWTGISTIAGILERKIGVNTGDMFYPNLYVFLVGDPGVGKTRSLQQGRKFIKLFERPDLKRIGPDNMTASALVDVLAEHKRTLGGDTILDEAFNAMFLMINEFSDFMSEYDPRMVGALTNFWEGHSYYERKRTNSVNITIPNPCLNMLACVTPSTLLRIMRDEAWDQGFMARTICIYASEVSTKNMFETPNLTMLPEDMVHDLTMMDKLTGRVTWTDEWEKAYGDWLAIEQIPKPNHPKLETYCSRRPSQLTKLGMIACVDRGDDMVLSLGDFNRALGWLLQAEEVMPRIFNSGARGSDGRVLDEAAHMVGQHYWRDKKMVSERVIMNYLKNHLPLNSLTRALETMETVGLIDRKHVDPKTGLRYYVPGGLIRVRAQSDPPSRQS